MDYQDRVTHFAETNWPTIKKRFGIKRGDRIYHMYIIGKTGMGKSTLLKNLIISDMRAGENLALLDPHGDLVEDLLDFVPEERLEDVVYFNPADTEYPVGFNVLENIDPSKRHLVASLLISIFKKLWSEFWGPRLEYILRNTVLSLLHFEGTTLLDVSRLLTNKDYRAIIVARLKDPELRNFWLNEFEKYSQGFRMEAVSPILNKVGQFLVYPVLRNIIGQKKSTFSLGKVMNEGGILLANLSKGKLGEDVSSLLGSLLVTAIEVEAQKRAEIPEHERKDFYLYLDEFQTFSTMSISHMLSEARKYHLSLILAHQYLDQINEGIRKAVFGNVGTIISFQIGASDARFLANEFYQIIDEEDLINLPRYHIYLKLVIDGITSRPFSAVTLPPMDGSTCTKSKVIRLSRERYGRPEEMLETKLPGLFIRPESDTDRRQGELF